MIKKKNCAAFVGNVVEDIAVYVLYRPIEISRFNNNSIEYSINVFLTQYLDHLVYMYVRIAHEEYTSIVQHVCPMYARVFTKADIIETTNYYRNYKQKKSFNNSLRCRDQCFVFLFCKIQYIFYNTKY